MRETSLYSQLKVQLDKRGTCSRVENLVESGMPDVTYCLDTDGEFGWIETKLERHGKLYFEKYQPAWAHKYLRQNARRLHVLTKPEHNRHGPITLYHYAEVVKAPRYVEKKWVVILSVDLTPLLIITRPYKWDLLFQALVM